MSWSARYKIIDGDLDESTLVESNIVSLEHNEQADVASNAIREIINSGAFGNPDNVDFAVNVSGHGNPGHVPASGWANDSITISITQL